MESITLRKSDLNKKKQTAVEGYCGTLDFWTSNLLLNNSFYFKVHVPAITRRQRGRAGGKEGRQMQQGEG